MTKPRIYFSGRPPLRDTNVLIAKRGGFRLATFAYRHEVHEWVEIVDSLGLKTSMLVDSGAFTVWSAGGSVDLKELIDYNKKVIRDYGNRHDFAFISLDVIPGERNRRPTSDEVDRAVEQSVDNFIAMQQELKGYYVLPVYHSDDKKWVRDKYLSMTDYICLSMNQNMPEADRVAWAVRSHVPGYHFHGLAATGNRMITEVPWFSVDSSAWLVAGSMGGVLIDNGRGFLRNLMISESSGARHEAGRHYSTLAKAEQEKLRAMFESKGYTVEELMTNHNRRHQWNAEAWFDASWEHKPSKIMELF